MQLQDFIIGVMAFILFSIMALVITFDFYGDDNYALNLSADADTAKLYDIQEKVEASKSTVSQINNNISSGIPGQNGTSIDDGNIDEGSLVKSGLQSVTDVPKYITIAGGLLDSSLAVIGIGTDDDEIPVFWFFVSSIIIIIGLILISSVLRNKL